MKPGEDTRLGGLLRRADARAITPARVLLVLAFVALYVGAAKLGLELSVAHGVITPVWAPTGIALAALVLFGVRLWPAVVVAAFIANAISGASFGEAAAISVGNTLEAVVGTLLLQRVGFRPVLDRVRDVLALIFLAAVASTTVSATNGVTALWISGDVPGSSYGSEWLLWWIGDGMGDLVVAPLVLVWATARPPRIDRAKALEAFALLALLVAVSSIVFLGGLWQYPHVLFPLLIWAPLRFRQHGAVTSSFVVAAIAIAGAVGGEVPLGDRSATAIVQILEGLLAAVTVGQLILGAVLAERRTTEEKLERAHATLADAQEVAWIGSWEWDIAADRLATSKELHRLYGLAPDAHGITFESFLERVHPDDRDRTRLAVERAYRDRQPFAVDHRAVMPEGRIRWLHGRGRVIVDETEVPVRMVGTAQDVTQRKQVDELRDNILSTVSHELRTPLTSIVGFALTLKDRGEQLSAEARAQMLTRLAEQTRKLDRLLSDLLDLDRLRHGLMRPTFRPIDVGDLVTRVASEYEADGHAIDVCANPVVAEIDAPKVERIVENLLANAVKHTAPGTKIRVLVESAEAGVLIAVEDQGPGVPETERLSIFEIFKRGAAVATTPGAGIGLSLVSQFAALHGGRVWVQENPEGGASFRVFLPARPSA